MSKYADIFLQFPFKFTIHGDDVFVRVYVSLCILMSTCVCAL